MRISINRMRGSLADKVGSGQAVFRRMEFLARHTLPKLLPTPNAGPFSPDGILAGNQASKHLLLISLWSSMLVRLFSDSLFNLPTTFETFRHSFSSAVRLQGLVFGKIERLSENKRTNIELHRKSEGGVCLPVPGQNAIRVKRGLHLVSGAVLEGLCLAKIPSGGKTA